METAKKLENINAKVSKAVFGKRRRCNADDYRGLVGPFFVIFGKLLCLPIVLLTAIGEGLYVGVKHAASVLERGM